MRSIVVSAALLAATPALAGGIGDLIKGKKDQQQTQPAPPNTPGPRAQPQAGAPAGADAAKIGIDVAVIELQATKLYLAGLADLAAKPTTWERSHAVQLFNEAQP